MIGEETGFGFRKAASATVHPARKAGFPEYVSGLLGAFLHPAQIRTGDENLALAPVPEKSGLLHGDGLLSPGEMTGGAVYTLSQREPGSINHSRAPRIFEAGGSRRIGFAIMGGSLDASLSHRPPGRCL